MARTRVSTTVDEELLKTARHALCTLTDASYTAYDTHPLEETDAWGDLASFRTAAGAS